MAKPRLFLLRHLGPPSSWQHFCEVNFLLLKKKKASMPLDKDNNRDSFKAVSHSSELGWTPNTIRSWDL